MMTSAEPYRRRRELPPGSPFLHERLAGPVSGRAIQYSGGVGQQHLYRPDVIGRTRRRIDNKSGEERMPAARAGASEHRQFHRHFAGFTVRDAAMRLRAASTAATWRITIE